MNMKITIDITNHGIKQVDLPDWSNEEWSGGEALKISISLIGNTEIYEGLVKDLKTYFSGQEVSFAYPIDWQGITPFDKRVLQRTQLIPWGQVETYGSLNSQLEPKSGPRAVGSALGRNPIPIIIPCHRVVKKDGGLGGFSSGIGWKKFLLALEQRNK